MWLWDFSIFSMYFESKPKIPVICKVDSDELTEEEKIIAKLKGWRFINTTLDIDNITTIKLMTKKDLYDIT